MLEAIFCLQFSLLQITVLEVKISERVIEPQGFKRASWPAFNGPESCLFSYMPDLAILRSAAHLFIHPFQRSELCSFNLPFNSSIRSHQNECDQLAVTDNRPFPPYCLPHFFWNSVLNRERTKTGTLLPSWFWPHPPTHTSKERENYGTESKDEFPHQKHLIRLAGTWTLDCQSLELLEKKSVLSKTQTPNLCILLFPLGRLKGYLLSSLLHNKDTD